MILGRFGDTSGRPYIEARVVLPRLKIAVQVPPPGEADVSFLADTGADLTTIMPADAVRFRIDFSKLENPFPFYGVGGKAEGFKEDGIVTFFEPGTGLRVYTIQVVLLKPSEFIMQCPSLLGRDIMNNWSILFSPKVKQVRATVLRADHTIKIAKGVGALPRLQGVEPPSAQP